MADTDTLYPETNTVTGSPRYGQNYKTVTAGTETFHVYASGDVERFTPASETVAPAASAPPVDLSTTDPTQPSNPLTTPPVAPTVNSAGTVDMSVVAEMQAQIAKLTQQLAAKPNIGRGALSVALSALDPAISLSQLEPGLKWAIRQGIVDAESIGSHLKDLITGENVSVS